MVDYHFRCDETLQAKGMEATLIVPYPTGILPGVPFEECGLRHLHKEWLEKTKPHSKVLVMVGYYGDHPELGRVFYQQDKRRRVIKEKSESVEPYFEEVK
jgi:hypothetical protein